MTGIYKHTIMIEVLTDYEDISAFSYADICNEMDFGEFLGVGKHTDVRELSRQEVIDEAYAMGGDPSFFGEEFEDGE